MNVADQNAATGMQRLEATLDVRRYGGKSASLSKALRAGLPVPPGFALDYGVVSALVSDGDAGLSLGAFSDLLEGPVAVRSSAIGEDSAGASFAGQHGTRLGVIGIAAVLDAIREVHASGSSAHALEYRRRMGLEARPQVAVAVQRMVRADCAGVLFTRHPVTGANEIVIEVVYGLGEMLVGGRATPAQYRITPDGGLLEFQPGYQALALMLGVDGSAREQARDPAEIDDQVLNPAQLRALAELARRCEAEYGRPQDLEWAFEKGQLFLLQARPITTLADKDTAAADIVTVEPTSLHSDPGHGILWSRVNVGEAIPGTVRPLTADFHRDSIQVSPQYMFQRMGVLAAGPVQRPRTASESPAMFLCGKMTLNVDYMRSIADRIPGTSGAALEEATLGRARPGVPSRPDRSRYAIIAVKLLWIIATLPRGLERLHVDTHRWWHESTLAVRDADLKEAVRRFDEACDRYARIIVEQGLIATLASAFWDPVARIVRRVATEDDLLQITTGYGNVLEAQMLEQLWEVSRDRLWLDHFIDRYGYLAASAGELSNPSWREDRVTLEQIVSRYRSLPESEHPSKRQQATHQTFEAARARVLRAAGPIQGVALRIALKLAGRMLPIREVGKACMVMGTDAARAAARRVGVLLAQRGDIANAEDVFYLSRNELRDAVARPGDRRVQVERLRRIHAEYELAELPDFFTSEQLREILQRGRNGGGRGAELPAVISGELKLLKGIGVSRGRCTGIARVVADPNRVARFDPGDILVCNITDPGWAALFSIAGGMVVDIGGMLSHSAIIARELGIPAVVNTRDGTRRIPDGARVMVDGATGEVTLYPLETSQEIAA